MFKAKSPTGQVQDSFETMGKSFLHLAVEYSAVPIIQFLLFEGDADPNQLTHNTQMSSLHLAVSRTAPSVIELLLMSNKT